MHSLSFLILFYSSLILKTQFQDLENSNVSHPSLHLCTTNSRKVYSLAGALGLKVAKVGGAVAGAALLKGKSNAVHHVKAPVHSYGYSR